MFFVVAQALWKQPPTAYLILFGRGVLTRQPLAVRLFEALQNHHIFWLNLRVPSLILPLAAFLLLLPLWTTLVLIVQGRATMRLLLDQFEWVSIAVRSRHYFLNHLLVPKFL